MQRGKSKYDYISYKWEFPGGKVEGGEAYEVCLARELNEELGIEIVISKLKYFMLVEHTYQDFAFEVHCYLYKLDSREYVRRVHIDHRWLNIEKLLELNWALADVPVVEKLIKEHL
ncbi:CTP pyrophosphohydrolase [Petrocella atlantisensis]|uniref:8-oxo-dGTP diphosphatase n=1 Tax=Petrocella atlantisensis TaxID=2173034 RepID=A0A3P7PE49_9FIRM|nr:NUDIX domain-containing protein [Petrocella atlantisensis]VDN48353.1 CTP pyrophosphohydrolase [Petrocella atlantisensis]